MRRWQSGQLQWTVNPSDLSYAGSNPARRTEIKRTGFLPVLLISLAYEQDSKDGGAPLARAPSRGRDHLAFSEVSKENG